MLSVGDKVRIKDKFVNDLGRKGEVMTIKRLYHLSNGTNETLMCDIGNSISYREDVLELVTEFDKAKAKHEELLAEREKAPKQETNLEHYINEIVTSLTKEILLCDCLPSLEVNKCDSNCCNCIFGNEEKLNNWLASPYKEQKVKLTQFEYDLLNTIENETTNVNYTNKLLILNGMIDKGYFKGINDTPMTIQDILDKAVIVDE